MSRLPNTEWLLPNLWEQYKNRRNVKLKHKHNLKKLSLSKTIDLSFNEDDVASLGEFAGDKHYEVVETVKKVGYESEDFLYKIHDETDREQIISMIKETIWRIRIKNSLTLVLWIVLILASIYCINLATNLVNGIISILTEYYSIFFIILATSVGLSGFEE